MKWGAWVSKPREGMPRNGHFVTTGGRLIVADSPEAINRLLDGIAEPRPIEMIDVSDVFTEEALRG